MSGYLIADRFSKGAVHMPRRYYVDTVIVKKKNGKEITDTVWHKISNLTLTNQLGKQVSLDDLAGQIIVADFFFTHCPSICPTLTRNMKKLQDAQDRGGMVGEALCLFTGRHVVLVGVSGLEFEDRMSAGFAWKCR